MTRPDRPGPLQYAIVLILVTAFVLVILLTMGHTLTDVFNQPLTP